MRRVHRRDYVHATLTRALEQCGCRVFDTSAVGGGFPDVVILDPRERIRMGEYKSDRGVLNRLQKNFHRVWPVDIFRTVEDVEAKVQEWCK